MTPPDPSQGLPPEAQTPPERTSAHELPVQVGVPASTRDPAAAFLVRMGEGLHKHGTHADRLEEALSVCARRLGRRGHFFSTPTSLFVALGEPGDQRTHLVRVSPGEVDLGRLVELDEVLRDVVEGTRSPEDGLRRIDEIESAPLRYGPVLAVLSYGCASASAACFFAGGLHDVLLAALIGLGIGALSILGEQRARVGRVVVPLAAFVASILALMVERATGVVSAQLATLSALIVLVPGLTLTVAIKELASGHWVSGTARLAGAGTTFLAIGLGVALGQATGHTLAVGAWSLEPSALPDGALYVALMVAPISFAVLFRACAQDIPYTVLAAVLAFFGARYGAETLGPEIGVVLGSLTVGIASEVYARIRHRPAAVTLVPGILVLVPGSIGFQSVASFLENDVLSGMEAAFRMTMVAVALAGGLLLSAFVLPPRRGLWAQRPLQSRVL